MNRNIYLNFIKWALIIYSVSFEFFLGATKFYKSPEMNEMFNKMKITSFLYPIGFIELIAVVLFLNRKTILYGAIMITLSMLFLIFYNITYTKTIEPWLPFRIIMSTWLAYYLSEK